jgi:hypothetical protein
MNKKYLPYLILFCALGLASVAGYYSIIGLSLLFAGVATPVIIMGIFLEISKLTIATLLHSYWKELKILMKTYLTTAVVVLSFITSIGIYGLLSSGYQSTERKDATLQNEIKLIETNIATYQVNKVDLKEELKQNQKDATQLRNALGNNNQSKVDKKGNVIVSSSQGNRKAYQEQLVYITNNENILVNKIANQDSLLIKETKHKLELESNSETAAELGPLTFISKLVMKDRGTIINWLILCIIFVFDPLAISLIVASNFAFEKNKKPKQKEYKTQDEELDDVVENLKEEEIEELIENSNKDNQEEEHILKQIDDIQNSNVASRNKHMAVVELQQRLDNIRSDEGNVKTY